MSTDRNFFPLCRYSIDRDQKAFPCSTLNRLHAIFSIAYGPCPGRGRMYCFSIGRLVYLGRWPKANGLQLSYNSTGLRPVRYRIGSGTPCSLATRENFSSIPGQRMLSRGRLGYFSPRRNFRRVTFVSRAEERSGYIFCRSPSVRYARPSANSTATQFVPSGWIFHPSPCVNIIPALRSFRRRDIFSFPCVVPWAIPSRESIPHGSDFGQRNFFFYTTHTIGKD